ncbi:MAG TPA: response regulator transcription factor [Actinomycetota bacterium]|nr:response regulator transcription factor [Actinomycetota bacterium]
MRITGSCSHVAEAVEATRASVAAAVLFGAQQPDETSSIKALAAAGPSAAIVVVSAWIDGRSIVTALRAGARGYMPEWASPDEIVDALAAAVDGALSVHPAIAVAGLAFAVERLDGPSEPEPLSRLTARERRVLDLLEDGMSPAEIASRLFLSKRTIQSHLQGAYSKLGVHGRVEAMWEYRRLRGHVGEHVS